MQVRRARRTLPAATTWIGYLAPHAPEPAQPALAATRTIEAVRFAVDARAPFRIENGVLLADATRYRIAGRPGVDSQTVLGRGGAATDHQHAHFVPIASDTGTIDALVLWVPSGLTPAEVATVIDTLAGPLSGSAFPGGEPVRGFPPTQLLLQAAGTITDIAPELCGPATRWHSHTPYLPVRHRKRRDSINEFLANDIATELAYRDLPAPVAVTAREPGNELTDRWALGYRRYRLRQNMGQAHVGLGVRLELAAPVTGPLLLGRLAHFGLGAFTPQP